jgi:DNA ligase (NAD+)
MSEMTLEKFIGRGFIHSFADLFRLKRWEKEIIAMEGFGEKSAENLEQSIERARDTTLPRLLFALGIPNIGTANARVISRFFKGDISLVRKAGEEEFCRIDGVGPVMAGALAGWFASEKNEALLDDLLGEITIIKTSDISSEADGDGTRSLISGKVFVVTGTVNHFQNRKQLQERIEEEGGKVTGSVSGKTDFLINNDVTSGSNKNRTAQKLGIPIITEEQFLEMLGEGGTRTDSVL